MQDVNSPDTPAACTAVMDITQDASFYRHSTYRAFLPPELCCARKERLKICTGSLVTRVELEQQGDAVRATGVHFEAGNARKAWRRYFARARREVVLCAGALGSPQVLMLRSAFAMARGLLSSTLTAYAVGWVQGST